MTERPAEITHTHRPEAVRILQKYRPIASGQKHADEFDAALDELVRERDDALRWARAERVGRKQERTRADEWEPLYDAKVDELRAAEAQVKIVSDNAVNLLARVQSKSTAHVHTLRLIVAAERKIEELEAVLMQIDAKDRAGHDSEVAADMGYIARRALASGKDKP